VTRRTFRSRVDAPRPASAWVLVTVASATLWITQQVALWAELIQVAALIASLLRRRDPHPWQKSGLALNLGMAGITLATITVATRGEPSTVALAHFAALTQGLQLLDARPRHTEFLLVALALFQVVLAANLTDSVFFTPLLVAFVGSAVWTLLVHTLRSEAIEAGDPREVTRAITPGLLRMTLVASALSVVLALALFVALPRLRSSVITGSGVSPLLASAGFSQRVELGDLGRIRQDSTLALRVETLEGKAPPPEATYYRGLAFDQFDGRSWSIIPPLRSLVAGSAEGGVTFGREGDRVNLVQRIVREPVDSGVLFGVGKPRRLQGTVRRLERDTSGGLYASGQAHERVRYTIASEQRSWHDEDLAKDHSAPEARDPERYLQLPELSPEVGELARRITAGASSDAVRARAIESHLARHGRYTDMPPPLTADGERSPIEAFLLGELAGHCEYFASAMVVLAREIGLHARLVNGFAGGQENRIGGFVELTRSDAHTWVEVHYARSGWVRYDPTPPDLRARPELALSLATQLRQLGSALELWWYQSVLGFDRSDQIHAAKRAWIAWQGVKRARREAGGGGAALLASLRGGVPWRAAVALLVCAIGAGVLLTRILRRRRGAALPADYAAALRLLSRRGLVRAPQQTAGDFLAAVAAAHPGAAQAAFAHLTQSYLAQRFGGRPAAPSDRELRALREALRRRRRGQPVAILRQASDGR
jgi:transglutaminase-like putative cysteine protease